MPQLSRRLFVQLGLASLITAPAGMVLAASDRVSTGGGVAALQGYDTHAYWTISAAREGTESFVVTWKGVPWHFASQADADAFAAAPESFAPQFGGFCTRAMSLKKVVDGDPEVWRIFEGKLYLFARPVGGRHFDKGEAEMIAKAQAFWETLD